MNGTNTTRGPRALQIISGVAAFLGGTLLASVVIIYSTEAAGCVGPEECALRPMRVMPPAIAAWGATAIALVLIGLVGLALLAYRTGGNRTLAGAGLATLATGAALLCTGAVIQAVFFDGDYPWMPLFVAPGVLCVLAAIALIAFGVRASGLLPSWMTVLLAASAAVALAFNEQNATVLFVVPLAVSVAAAGAFLTASTLRPTRVRATEPLAG